MLDQPANAALALRPTIPPSADNVLVALRGAADRTGADFDYLLNTAMRESALNPEAKARTSSATGLFQFIEQTWLGTVHRHGAEHGLGKYADAIKLGKDGRYTVADKDLKQEILALRKDPNAASLMAGEMTNDMRSDMEAALGRGVSAGELYVAHFLGPQAAVKLVKAAAETPAATAASLFSDAASANNRIFYNKAGQARSVQAVLENLKAKHQQGSDVSPMMADLAPRAISPTPAAEPLRGTLTSDFHASLPTVGNIANSFGMNAIVMSPLLAQILSSVDPLPSLAAVFRPDDDVELRPSRL